MYCHARDRGTEVEVGITPSAGVSHQGEDIPSIGVLCIIMAI